MSQIAENLYSKIQIFMFGENLIHIFDYLSSCCVRYKLREELLMKAFRVGLTFLSLGMMQILEPRWSDAVSLSGSLLSSSASIFVSRQMIEPNNY